jgi:hypothetical protein
MITFYHIQQTSSISDLHLFCTIFSVSRVALSSVIKSKAVPPHAMEALGGEEGR